LSRKYGKSLIFLTSIRANQPVPRHPRSISCLSDSRLVSGLTGIVGLHQRLVELTQGFWCLDPANPLVYHFEHAYILDLRNFGQQVKNIRPKSQI